jgi:hypothetical protein
MSTTITYDKLHEASVERNQMTGDFTCKLCGCVWGSNAKAEFHRPDCLLAESGFARDIERLRVQIEGLEKRLQRVETICDKH